MAGLHFFEFSRVLPLAFAPGRQKSIVFCGFGEPTERLDALLEIAKYLKAHYDKPIRINTNGLGDLIWKEDITPKLAGLIDTISISLNTPDAKRYVPKVILSTVETTITREEETKCRAICDELGVIYRIRPFH